MLANGDPVYFRLEILRVPLRPRDFASDYVILDYEKVPSRSPTFK